MMLFDRIVAFFMPKEFGGRVTDAKYHEFRVVVSACLTGLLLTLLFPLLLHYMEKAFAGYLVNSILIAIILLSVKFFGHYRIPMTVTALVTYFIIYDWIRDSGLIYSPNVSVLHMYLLGAIWVDKRYGWWAIFTNLALFGFIYCQTLEAGLDTPIHHTLGGPLYALVMNCLITVFFGAFLAYLQFDQERDRLKIKNLQEQKITMLDEAVKTRTMQLNSMRETMATDFHDETGNMLSAITRQASLLKQKLGDQHQAQPIVESILTNSNSLYAVSKDFLWHLNHDSDDPNELFNYLTAYGQLYYNQFDIAFSSEYDQCREVRLVPSAALHIIYIFKEAMTNVVKHAGAQEVIFEMRFRTGRLIYSLQDDGRWQTADEARQHYGLQNMERRCFKNGFAFKLSKEPTGTRIAITVPADINTNGL